MIPQEIRAWLEADTRNTLRLQHGGPGGRYFCELVHDDEPLAEGVGSKPGQAMRAAVTDAGCHIAARAEGSVKDE